jgi:hypothetical protein
MHNSFLFATFSPDLAKFASGIAHRLPQQDFPTNHQPQVGDLILMANGRNESLDTIAPQQLVVSAIENGNVLVQLDLVYLNPAPIDKVRTALNRPLSEGGNWLQPGEFDQLVALMGGVRLTELQLLDHIRKYIDARGFYFDAETVFNYHICLKTRPFVILAGLSGTGKSKLSQLYAEAIGHNVQNGRYLRLAVRPSWNDDRYLLGYLNSITGEYVTEPAIDFVMQAEKDRQYLYFFCLDEMNLAHVEYYFSQFLSALEEESAADRRVLLYSKATEAALQKQGKKIGHGREAIISSNLLFTGTINVDETTQPLSDKVIDRANTLEFFDVDLKQVPDRKPTPPIPTISASTWQSYQIRTPDVTFRPSIVELSQIMHQANLGFGFRVLREIELYLANSAGLLRPEVAFDLQVKQRVLPRVRGTAVILPMLGNLKDFLKKNNMSRSLKRLEEMEQRLRRDGYTSFWR